MSPSDHPLLIVGGAEKAGTTSLYAYLAAHPSVCASSAKETDFFRAPASDLRGYSRFFSWDDKQHTLAVEASPGYLAEADAVAPRIARLVPRARVLMLLRDPVDRLASSFRFYKNRLHLPERMGFESFVGACFDFNDDPNAAGRLGVQPWHLGALQRGRYDVCLGPFHRCLPPQQLLLVHYDDLRSDAAALMGQVADFAGIDRSFYTSFEFGRENVGFQVRRRGLQRAAIMANDGLQRFWRAHPALKHRLLRLYKAINEQPAESVELSSAMRVRLDEYYAPTLDCLQGLPRVTRDATADAGGHTPPRVGAQLG